MFTGIIEGTGKITNIEGNRFALSHPFGAEFAVGESIACNGMCATVLTSNTQQFTVEIIGESRRLTTFGSAEVGDEVNLERAAVVGQRNSGHNVTGHIDQLGEVVELKRQDDYYQIRVAVDPANRKLLVYKGSVALNGISLTVSGVSELFLESPHLDPLPAGEEGRNASGGDQNLAWFEVSIISHTWEVTNLKNLVVGDKVNVEFDVLGKYALNLVNGE